MVRFNTDRKYPNYQSAQLPQLEFYAKSGLRVVCPTKIAIDDLNDAVRECVVPPVAAP